METSIFAERGPGHGGLFRGHTPARRWSTTAGALSLVFHAIAIGGVLAIGTRQVFSPRPTSPGAMTFLMFPAPLAPVEVLKIASAPSPKTMESLTLPVRVEEPPSPPPEITKPVPPAPVPQAPKIAAAIAPRPAVRLGAFASAATIAPTPEPARRVEIAGFDAASAIAPDLKLRTATVGAFDANTSQLAPRPGTDRPGVVAGGFEGGRVAAPTGSAGRVVAHAGFGSTSAAGPAAASGDSKAVVRSSGFADLRPVSPSAGVPAAADTPRTPVEVLFKPTPAYTDEARSLKIEGEVVLEVDFTASSQVRVVRVVRGLGHGLDEMAIQAAEKIRFKPAMSGGRPVDFRASVTIVFRLA